MARTRIEDLPEIGRALDDAELERIVGGQPITNAGYCDSNSGTVSQCLSDTNPGTVCDTDSYACDSDNCNDDYA